MLFGLHWPIYQTDVLPRADWRLQKLNPAQTPRLMLLLSEHLLQFGLLLSCHGHLVSLDNRALDTGADFLRQGRETIERRLRLGDLMSSSGVLSWLLSCGHNDLFLHSFILICYCYRCHRPRASRPQPLISSFLL